MDTNSEEEGYTLEDAIKQSLLSRNKLAMIMQGPNDEIHFSCVECSYKCSEKEQMEQHFLLHNKEYRYLCGICGTGLKRKEHLDRHTLEHQEYRPHICADCGKAFKRKEHMNIHRSIHRGDRNEQCTICHKAFYRKDHLQKHLQTHAKSFIKHNVPPIISEAMVEIKQEFDDEDELPISTYLDYQDVKPNVEDVDYQDQPNGDDFEEQDIKPDIIEFENDGDGNQTMEDDDESAQFIGDGDGMGYVTALSPSQVYVDGGDEEMEAGMESEELSFNEDLIPKPKRQKVKEKRPERDLSFSQERPYQCYLCHKAYKRRDHLKLHSYTHKEKEKICNVCGKAFSRDPQLRAHMKVHSATYTTNRRGGLKTIQRQTMLYSGQYTEEDIRMMERASKMNGESRPHECTVCQRRFKRKQHLKQHLNVHFKPHQPNVWCSICGEGFDTSERFENHRCTGSEDGSSSRMYIGQTVKHDKKENKYPTEFVSVNLSEPDPAPRVPESELPIPQRVFVCKFCTKPFKRKDHYKIHLHIHTGIKSFFCDTCGKGFYRKDHWQKHVTIHTRAKEMAKQWRQVPALFPIEALPKKKLRSSDKKRTDDTKKTEDQKTAVKPEITIHAPSNSKIRVPLQIKVPYQMVMSMDNGEQRAVTVEPQQSPS